jgi:hypothetical protein
MKKFKKIILETSQSFGGSIVTGFSEPSPRSASSDKGVHYAFQSPEQLARLNQFIQSFLSGSYVDPRPAIKELAARLHVMGLTVEFDNTTPLRIGKNQFKVKVFGDKFGVTPTTDLTKQPFDRGEDYPDMILEINVMQTLEGYSLVGSKILSSACTDCPTGLEPDAPPLQNLKQGIQKALENVVEESNSSQPIVEEKDYARSVELFLSKDSDASKRILQPIYQSLNHLIKRKKYTTETAMKRFLYAIESAQRTMTNDGKLVKLSSEDKTRAAKRLLINFEKHVKDTND